MAHKNSPRKIQVQNILIHKSNNLFKNEFNQNNSQKIKKN